MSENENNYYHSVQPIVLPDAAGEDEAGGDVRHFAREDALGAAAIARPTRHLAMRDTILGNKLNELIHIVNNQEQYIVLPTIRTRLVPGEVSVVCNHWIPEGFEARVLSAAVHPANEAKVEVHYNKGVFGAVSGDLIVASTMSKSTSGTEFFGEGEFVIRISNVVQTSIDSSASVVITMRPVGAVKGALIGPGTQGNIGETGLRGVQGPAGTSDVPGPKGDGFTWKSDWLVDSSYIQGDVVRFTGDALHASVWVSKTNHTSTAENSPPVLPAALSNANWDLFVEGGAPEQVVGDPGPIGDPGFTYEGYWVANTGYPARSLVNFIQGNLVRVFFATSAISEEDAPAPPTAPWVEFFGPSAGPIYSLNQPTGGGDYSGTVVTDVPDSVFENPPALIVVPYQEMIVRGGSYQSGSDGFGSLSLELNLYLSSDSEFVLTLPTTTQAVSHSILDWSEGAAEISVNEVKNLLTTVNDMVVTKLSGGTGWKIVVDANGPARLSIRVYGVQSIAKL